MRLLSLLLVVSLPCFAQAPDAPTSVTLSPSEAHEAAKRVLVCEADLKACQQGGQVEQKWVWIGIAAGVVAGIIGGVGIGFAVGKASK